MRGAREGARAKAGANVWGAKTSISIDRERYDERDGTCFHVFPPFIGVGQLREDTRCSAGSARRGRCGAAEKERERAAAACASAKRRSRERSVRLGAAWPDGSDGDDYGECCFGVPSPNGSRFIKYSAARALSSASCASYSTAK